MTLERLCHITLCIISLKWLVQLQCVLQSKFGSGRYLEDVFCLCELCIKLHASKCTRWPWLNWHYILLNISSKVSVKEACKMFPTVTGSRLDYHITNVAVVLFQKINNVICIHIILHNIIIHYITFTWIYFF